MLDWVHTHAPQGRVVLASSAAVYGNAHTTPIPESARPQPYYPYGFHKRMGELCCQAYAQSYGLNTSIVRFFSVFGAELRKQLLWDLCHRFRHRPESIELWGSGDEVRDWIHIGDAVRYLQRAADMASETCPVINGGSGRGTPVSAIAAFVRDAWNPRTELRFNHKSRPGDPFYLVADAGFAKSLGINAQADLESEIHRYVAWFQERTSE